MGKNRIALFRALMPSSLRIMADSQDILAKARERQGRHARMRMARRKAKILRAMAAQKMLTSDEEE